MRYYPRSKGVPHVRLHRHLLTFIMKGLLITEYKKPYQYSTEIPIPKIEKPNEILIKIAVAGYCHTEMMVVNGEFHHRMNGRTLPLVPSHEGTGTVVDIGSAVTNVKVCFFSSYGILYISGK